MFLMYAVIAVFTSLSVRGRSRHTAEFATPDRQKSGGVRSGERGGHKFLEICSPKNLMQKFNGIISCVRSSAILLKPGVGDFVFSK